MIEDPEVVIHPQDQKTQHLLLDEALPMGGRPITVNIYVGATDVGNCTMRYVTYGVLCTVEYLVTTFPSSGSPWEFPLPALIEHDQIIGAGAYDANTGHARTGWAVLSAATQRIDAVYLHDTTSGAAYVRAGYPVTWASGDWLRIYGTYMCRAVVSA